MKQLFEGEICPVCNARFFEDDDVVFCPDCGTPHHRQCWQKNGKCFYADQHGIREDWKPTQNNTSQNNTDFDNMDKNESYRQGSMTLCRQCGKIYPKNLNQCPSCGGFENPQHTTFDPFGNSGQSQNPFSVAVDPLGGVDTETDIEGVKAIELAPVVATNTRRYIPVFAKKKAAGWNWAAFLIPAYWFSFRKCYFWGFLFAALSVCSFLLTMPFLDWVQTLVPEAGISGTTQLTQLIMQHIGECPTYKLALAYSSTIFAIFTRVFAGLFGDLIYRKHCVKTLKELKTDDTVEDFSTAVMKKGGISLFAPLLIYLLVQALEVFLPSLI